MDSFPAVSLPAWLLNCGCMCVAVRKWGEQGNERLRVELRSCPPTTSSRDKAPRGSKYRNCWSASEQDAESTLPVLKSETWADRSVKFPIAMN